jgi:hypothetical protein
MAIFEHFLLTQFNLKVRHSSPLTRLDPTWLESRFELFDRFCYPSVRTQSEQNFKWIVYFDSQTPILFKDKIAEYANWKNFIPIYLDDELTDEVNRKTILNHFSSAASYLITTRIDNDDAICKSYIKDIHLNFDEQEFKFMSFINGHVLHVDGRLYRFRYLNNPFISLIERIDQSDVSSFRTVLCGPHTELSKIGSMKQIQTPFSWLQIIHGKNVSNKIRGLRCPAKNLLDQYEIDLSFIPNKEYWLSYCTDWLLSLANYSARETFINLSTLLSVGYKRLRLFK